MSEFIDKLEKNINQWKINKDKDLDYVMSDEEAIKRFILLIKHANYFGRRNI